MLAGEREIIMNRIAPLFDLPRAQLASVGEVS